MNSIKLLAASVTILTLVAGCGAPSYTGRESYKQYGEQIEDTRLITRIRTEFRRNPLIPDRLIYLAVDRGIVQLSGFVRTHQEADLAILSARNTPGVKDVINNLIVLSSSEYSERRAMAEGFDTKR